MRQKIGNYGYNIWTMDHSIAGYLGLYTDDFKRIAQIAFINEGHNIHGNFVSENGIVNLNLSINKRDMILDILRNESPVYFSYNSINKNGVLSTSKEPVGEGE